MTQRQQDIITIRTAWELHFPGSPEIPLIHVCSWLNNSDLSRILAIIEDLASRHRIRPYNNPEQVAWSRIRSKQHVNVLRFDGNGVRV